MSSVAAWTLVFHILGFVFWMGGLLVATQVLAMRARETSTESRAILSQLETRLLKGVAHPGAAITVAAGIILVALQPGLLARGWLRAKIVLVAVLVALDLVVSFRSGKFQTGDTALDSRWCKIMHGAISLVFIGILVLVIIRPSFGG